MIYLFFVGKCQNFLYIYNFVVQVQVEHCPNEVFIHLTPTKSWDMVRERVNLEIRRAHNHGKSNIPTLQHQYSIDGLEMFGLNSPPIIQVT